VKTLNVDGRIEGKVAGQRMLGGGLALGDDAAAA
jgi:hypothetical protein